MSDKPKNKNTLKPTKGKGNANRRRGHQYERDLAREFRELGYPRCRTTRETSKLLDACKVDLDIPDFNIQAKSVRAGIKYSEIFDDIDEKLAEHYPERLGYISAILHKKMGEELVILKKEDFYKLVTMYLNQKQLPNVVNQGI